jgi:hypothetical protein
MQHIFQNAKRLMTICIVTLLLLTNTLLSFPAPAMAAGDVVIFKCETDCGNMAAFGAGVISGSAVTLAATGNGGVAAAGVSTGITAIGQAATMVAAPLVAAAAPAVVAAAPIVVPVAVGAAVVGGGYLLWQQLSQASAPK